MPTWTKEQSDAIYKSGTNIIVSAGAGSGKTAVLTARVIEKLKQGIHINELLILTFTKAAAGEMKERIRKNIKKNPELKSELSLLDTAYITTFDAFSLAIVKKYHYLLNITSNPEITEDTMIEMVRQDTLREVLDSFYLKKDEDFTKMIEDFCVKDDEEIYTCLLHMTKKLENDFTRNEKIKQYDLYFNNIANFDNLLKEFLEIIKSQKEEIKEKLNQLTQIAPKEYGAKCYESLNPLLEAQELNEMISVRSVRMPTLPKNMEEEVKKAKEEVNASLKKLVELLNYGSEEKLKQDLDQMQKYIQVFRKIIQDYFVKFEQNKTKLEYYDFNDIAFLALKLLQDFPDVREEIKNSFQEIMIDEYQDTNNIQEQFISYISDHNVYMVGDIKQSIYRFRNANPYIFKNKYDTYRNSQNGEKIDLLKNFRSRKEVLQNINQIFNLIMDDEIGGANYLEEHQMVFGNLAYIEKGTTNENYQMEILTYTPSKELGFSKEEIEIFTIGRDIQKKVQEGYLLFDKDANEIHPATYQDFVILMDRTTNFDLYKRIFNYLKIPICLYKDETFSNTTCFYIIKNILTICIGYKNRDFNQKFQYAFTSISRSFLFEYSDATIYQILTERKWYQNTIYDSLKPIIESLTYQPLNEIIQKIYESTNIYEKLIKIGDIEENIQILLKIKNLASSFGKDGQDYNGFTAFLERIVENEMQMKYSANETASNSVKIMTIHKSKGLEYPICYFSGLYKSFNISDIKDKFLYDEKYGIVTPLKDEGLYKCFLQELMKENFLEAEISEKIRLFYVAVTRAKEKMIMVLPDNQKEQIEFTKMNRLKQRSFADFLYSIWGYLKEYIQRIDLVELKLSKQYLLEESQKEEKDVCISKIEVEEIPNISQKLETRKFSKNNFVLNTKDDYKNIKLGILVHEYLEWIDFQNPNYHKIPNEYIRKKIQNFISSSLIQNNLQATFYKEYEFCYQESETEYHGIIDLMIETDHKIIIVDYKLNTVLDEAYYKQIMGYQEYISYKTKKTIETYLYSILDEKMIEVTQRNVMI